MPIYSYLCTACGPFDRLRPMAQSQQQSDCPVCGTSSPRMLTAARLNLMPSANRLIRAHNERNAEEPRVVRKAVQPGHHEHVHKHAEPSRPWMVGH